MYDRYRAEYECDEEARLCKTLSESGLSISLTSLCSSMAFTIGSTTDLPAISAFCKFAAWSFLANYFLQFLIFVPLMIYENQRIQKGNNFCCPCCFKHTTDNNNNNSDFSTVSLNDHDKKNREIKTDSESETEVNKFKIEYFLMRMCIIPILSKRIGRWIIIFIFTAILYASIYVSFDIQSYNLPQECDFTSQIEIKFTLESASQTINNVFIDYVSLTHSNPSGNNSVCIAPPTTTTQHIYSKNGLQIVDYIIICACSIVILIAIIFIIIYTRRKMKMASYIPVVDIEDISNPLVGIIAIGDYNNMNVVESDLPDNVQLDDIPVHFDVENLQRLFKRLNYKVFPNNKEIKIHWTEEEVVAFLKNIADELFDENHNLKHDGLILFVCVIVFFVLCI